MGLIINPYSFGGGGGGPPAWSPLSLADLVAWYDADQQSEGNGASVNQFTDRSGNGFHFDQIGAEAVPTMATNFVNGKKALVCGGAGYDHNNTLLASVSACTAIWVAKGTSDPSSGGGPDEAPLNGFGTGGVSHYFTDGNWYESFGTNSRRSTNPPTSWASWRITGVTSGNNDFKMWWDGTAIVSQSSNTVTTGTNDRRLFSRDSGSGHFSGHFAELILCDAVLSTGDRQSLEGYLAHKYGLTANLPGGHPYISSPP